MREPLMGQSHGLGPLQVRIARQDRVDVLPCPFEEDCPQLEQCALARQADVAQEEREVRRDLVVARATGVELARHGPQMLPQARLDIHVDFVLTYLEPRFVSVELVRPQSIA